MMIVPMPVGGNPPVPGTILPSATATPFVQATVLPSASAGAIAPRAAPVRSAVDVDGNFSDQDLYDIFVGKTRVDGVQPNDLIALSKHYSRVLNLKDPRPYSTVGRRLLRVTDFDDIKNRDTTLTDAVREKISRISRKEPDPPPIRKYNKRPRDDNALDTADIA